MTFNTSMPGALKPFYMKELDQYRTFVKARDYQSAWRYLERAHILGQAYPLAHSQVHWLMLRFGFTIKDYKEILG